MGETKHDRLKKEEEPFDAEWKRQNEAVLPSGYVKALDEAYQRGYRDALREMR